MNEDPLQLQRSEEKRLLFRELKSVVERILSQHSFDVWSVHGGLQSLVISIDEIFQHGNKPHSGILGPVVDYWLFVRGLRWLEPTLTPEIDYLSKLAAASPSKLRESKAKPLRFCVHLTHGQQWLEKSLKDRSLSRQIKILLSDLNHLQEHYHEWAFLLDESFTSAILTCISALEQNSPVLLANIPVTLFGRRRMLSTHSNVRMHRAVTSDSEKLTHNVAQRRHYSLVEPSKVSSPIQVPKVQSESDPLSASLKTEILSRKQYNGSFKDNSISKTSSSKSLSSDDKLVAMGMMTSACVSNPSASWVGKDTTEELSLQERLLPKKNYKSLDQTSPSRSRARKPLFYDSSDNECDPDDLGFLLSPMTEISVSQPKVDNYFVAIDAASPLVLNSLPDTDLRHQTNLMPTQKQDLTHSALPDIVRSAEVSRASKLQNNATLLQQSSAIYGDCDITMMDGPVLTEISRPEKPVEVAVGVSPSHRRSKSDHILGMKSLKNNLSDAIDDEVEDDLNKLIKPSTSLPHIGPPLVVSTDDTDSKSIPKSRSLMNYLKNQDLTTCADIDKENAHFNFSEILIGAMEQMKCRMQDQPMASVDSSNVFMPGTSVPFQAEEEDMYVAQHSHLSVSESYHSPVGSFAADVVQNASASASGLPLDGSGSFSRSPSENFKESGETQLKKLESLRTAESIAIGLLRTFSGQRHVSASEVDWLISEDDVPQKLLPLPRSTAIDPDSSCDHGIRIRGNQDWAPPRPQIIFKAPIKLKVKAAMANQNNRCAGCGTLVEKAFMKRFRYCEYLGKYFCTCCHDNKLSILPANVLQRFDFTKYKVSNFSYDLLLKINSDPLFNVNDIKPHLYKKHKVMSTIWDLRVQLNILNKYLQVCRMSKSSENDQGNLVKKIMSHFQPHLLGEDPHVYSLYDLEGAKSGELLDDLKEAVDLASYHVTNCQFCRLKGFICEFCNSEDIIFPHQASASTCQLCKSCFHKKCYVATNCPKCARIQRRKAMLRQISEE